MTVGRISTLSSTLTRTVALILLAALLPAVKADNCWIDDDGYEHCDGLSTGARIGIGIGLWIIFLSLIFSMIVYRRRRAARANLAFTQQHQQGGYGGQTPYQPQYPPQAYGGAAGVHPHSYDPNAGFAPPAGSPPQYYPPPSGAPPVDQGKMPYHV
ncbi:hypothetical protein V8E53_013150 [Lactarius tabidus]